MIGLVFEKVKVDFQCTNFCPHCQILAWVEGWSGFVYCFDTFSQPVNQAVCFDFLLLNFGGLTGLPFLLPLVDLKKRTAVRPYV
jgi:hypothetical protein